MRRAQGNGDRNFDDPWPGGRRGACRGGGDRGEKMWEEFSLSFPQTQGHEGAAHSQSPWPLHGSLTPGQMVLMLTALSVSHDEQAAPITGSGLV